MQEDEDPEVCEFVQINNREGERDVYGRRELTTREIIARFASTQILWSATIVIYYFRF